VFFLAFLPQFVNPQRGPVVLQIMLLGGLFIAATIVVFGGIAVLAGTIAQRLLGSQRAQRIANRTAALVFIGLAIKLALSQR
jgi:threonine/homoserine/homoserine lactone efflux protein